MAMANNENLNPAVHYAGWSHNQRQSHLTENAPFSVPSRDPSPHSLPFPPRSPCQDPSSNRQRDRSSCGKADTPLKIRKTRENLRQAKALYAEGSPPYLHHLPKSPGQSSTQYVTVTGAPSKTKTIPIASNTTCKLAASAFGTNDDAPSTDPVSDKSAATELPRHRLVGRHMLSRVKEGISQRSKSTQSIRMAAADAENSLLRRFSSKRKKSQEVQRNLCDHGESEQVTSIGPSTRPSLKASDDCNAVEPRQSLTESQFSTHGVKWSDGSALSPTDQVASVDDVGPRSSRPLPVIPPSEPHSPSHGSNPDRSLCSTELLTVPTCSVPYVGLKVFISRGSLDVALERVVWVAAEATVSTRTYQTSDLPSATHGTETQGIDAVILLSQLSSSSETQIARHFVDEFALRLNASIDRLAVLRTISQPFQHGFEWLYILQTPNISLLSLLPLHDPGLETRTTSGESFLPAIFDKILQGLRQQGIDDRACQFFVISNTPTPPLRQYPTFESRRVHDISVGIRPCQPSGIEIDPCGGWALELNSLHDFDSELLSNLIRTIRQRAYVGFVTSLRICFKPLQHCKVMEVVGQKALKGLRPGQRCCLLFKIHVPRVQANRSGPGQSQDPDSLIAELESMVGTLETNILHVEARYRHSMLPRDNVVTVRQIVSIVRPRADSRWSMIGSTTENASPWRVYHRLAQHVASHQPPARALKLMDRWIPSQYASSDAVTGVRRQLEAIALPRDYPGPVREALTAEKPSVVVITATGVTRHKSVRLGLDGDGGGGGRQDARDAVETVEAPSCRSLSPGSSSSRQPSTLQTLTPSPRLIPGEDGVEDEDEDAAATSPPPDAARQVWRHIRRTSRSAHQVLDLSVDQIQQLAAGDSTLQERRTRALANKRSIGAETLRDWRWEDRAIRGGEAPWL